MDQVHFPSRCSADHCAAHQDIRPVRHRWTRATLAARIPRIARAEALDVAAPVDGATVPEQIDGAPEVTQQVSKEGLDVEAREIAGAAVKIERDLAPPGRHGHPTADREAIVAISVPQIGGLPAGRPGPPDIGDE